MWQRWWTRWGRKREEADPGGPLPFQHATNGFGIDGFTAKKHLLDAVENPVIGSSQFVKEGGGQEDAH